MAIKAPGGLALFTLSFLVCLAVGGILLGGPPAPLPATAPPAEFSAERAMAHVEQMAQRPHPVGSADHARVRDYLVNALGGLGLKAEIQSAVVRRGTTTVRMARVENILARIKGTQSTGAVLLASHYDSVPAAPGAADAGSGVAALLEAMRAFKTGPPPRNDVIVLFTDGEELGLLGAKAFVEQHPSAKDVRMTMNFEARGTFGPAWMFETNAGNGTVVAEWAALVPKPSGSSLTYEVYKRLPNDTDFTEFKSLKTAGLNFAFVGGLERYHTPGDAVSLLDRGSLQHHGDAALQLTRRFAMVDLGSLHSRDSVYFSLPILNVVPRYSTVWVLPLAGALLILFCWAAARARRRQAASVGGMILAAVVFAAFAGAAGYLGWRYGRLATTLHARWLPEGNVLMSGPYATALPALLMSAWLALYVLLRKKFAAHSLALGSACVLLLAAAATSWFAAGASFVFVWPVAAALLAALVTSAAGTDNGVGIGIGAALLVCVLAAPAVLIVCPLAQAFFVTMGLAPESGLAIAVVTATGLGALVLPVEVIVERRRWWPAGVALFAALAAVGVGAMLTRYSERHPKPANVFYVLDADAKHANWAVKIDRPDPWFRQFLGPSPRPGRPSALVPPWSSVTGVVGFLQNDAPVLDLPAPRASLLSAVPTDGGRDVSFLAAPGREGGALSVWVNGAPALEVSVDGKRIGGAQVPRAPDDTAWTLEYYNAPASGVTITLMLKGTHPLTVAVVERSAGLPVQPGAFVHTTRPGSLVPIQTGDLAIVRRTYTF